MQQGIRIVSCQYKRFSSEQALQVHLQEVVFDDVIFQQRIFLAQVGYGFIVQFDNLYRTLFFYEKLGQYAHSRTYFQYRESGTCIYGVGYVLRHFQVFQEVLAEKLLGFY